MFRPILTAAALALTALALPAVPAAAAPVALTLGDPAARHVTFTFGPDRAAPDALVIETRRVGNPGAALRIWIDNSPVALVDRVLTADDCRFDDAGAACRVTVDGTSGTYARFVTSFRRGRTAHVTVQNAGVMEMQDDLSLTGFTAAYGR
jgi:hypothetical protein